MDLVGRSLPLFLYNDTEQDDQLTNDGIAREMKAQPTANVQSFLYDFFHVWCDLPLSGLHLRKQAVI